MKTLCQQNMGGMSQSWKNMGKIASTLATLFHKIETHKQQMEHLNTHPNLECLQITHSQDPIRQKRPINHPPPMSILTPILLLITQLLHLSIQRKSVIPL